MNDSNPNAPDFTGYARINLVTGEPWRDPLRYKPAPPGATADLCKAAIIICGGSALLWLIVSFIMRGVPL